MKQKFFVAQARDDISRPMITTWWKYVFSFITTVPEHIDPVILTGRLILYIIFVIWGCYFIFLPMESNEIGQSFMHNINLVFHEAGHVIFRIFGNFMMILGGSLAQLLMPLIVMLAFQIVCRSWPFDLRPFSEKMLPVMTHPASLLRQMFPEYLNQPHPVEDSMEDRHCPDRIALHRMGSRSSHLTDDSLLSRATLGHDFPSM